MSNPESYELIDRHLAGILTPEEEARLEALIRDDREWARRYREAEEMAGLLHNALSGAPKTGAPAWAKRAVHAGVHAAKAPEQGRWTRRHWLVAAGVLCALGAAYLFVPERDAEFLPVAYTQEPLPLKDLARASDVLMLGRTEAVDGRLRFHVDASLYGKPAGRACALPAGVEGGQRIALFGRFEGDDMILAVGEERGIVHLDGVQRWEGNSLQPDGVRALLERSVDVRTSASAMEDLRRFLDGTETAGGVDPADGLYDSAVITARYLGRFEAPLTRPLLMRLVMDREKPVEARSAGAGALVQADPLNACRTLLKRILMSPVEMLHGESEDGLLVLRCLDLIRASGGSDLASDLRTFARRSHCPTLKQAAGLAARAVVGEAEREAPPSDAPHAVRIVVEGREVIVVPGCRGKKEGLVAIFRGDVALGALNPLLNRAVGQGLGVLVLPADLRDVQAVLPAAEATGLVVTSPLTYLGLGGGADDAVEAARSRAPGRLLLVGALTDAFEALARDGGPPEGAAVEAWPVDGARPTAADVQVHRLEAASLEEALMLPALWKAVLPGE